MVWGGGGWSGGGDWSGAYLDAGSRRAGTGLLDARYLVPNARKMDSMGKIGKYKYYRTLRLARERQ